MVRYLCFSLQQQQQQPFYGPLSGTTRVSQYQKKHSPTHHPDHHPIFISFFHLPRSIASSLFKLRAWQSFCTTFLHVLFGLPLGLEPCTSIMVALWNRALADHYIFILFLSSFFISSPNLSGRRLNVYHTSTHGVALAQI